METLRGWWMGAGGGAGDTTKLVVQIRAQGSLRLRKTP